MEINLLKKIGLSDKDIKVYLCLLTQGTNSVRGIASITDLNRGTVYDILKRLQKQGLVSYYHQKTKQKFVAENPEKLLSLSKEKEKEIKKIKQKLIKIIPELDSLRKKKNDKPVTKFYENSEGLKFILEDILNSLTSNEEYYIYSAKHGSDDINVAYPDFTKDRINKKIRVKAISLADGGGLSGLDERKWLGTSDESATFIIIYANKCAFISRDLKNNPVGVIIENKMIYETQKIIFLQFWKLLKN